ncbi:hypothetical protein [Streptomyces sp.]|uniref:hypothetical protein n=1 Tax=Streptomyces sp. TaxID=1931 RepID=UPI002F94C74A
MSTWYRIADGTGILARRAGAWLAGNGWHSLALRAGTTALLGPHLLPPALDGLRSHPLAVPAATAAGLGAAWWAGRPSNKIDNPSPPPPESPSPNAKPQFTSVPDEANPHRTHVVWHIQEPTP